VQIFGWFSEDAALASRWKRLRACASLASSSGRNFRAIETVTLNNDSYDVQTSSVSRSLKGKGKRTATFIGGGAGGGALIGGLAGGGKVALIGAASGAGAGTAGAAYTGEKEIVLPAESALSFKLTEPLTIKM
jgi:hypothetical protein